MASGHGISGLGFTVLDLKGTVLGFRGLDEGSFKVPLRDLYGFRA